MVYLILMLVAIAALILYGVIRKKPAHQKMGLMLLAVWAACLAGYLMFGS